MRLILASQSPRRRELLQQMGFRDFDIVPARGGEETAGDLSPGELVEVLSARKAAEVSARHPEDLVIAADTVVAEGEEILGKPHTEEEAKAMLALLSGRANTVYSGVTVRLGSRAVTEHESTRVFFRTLSSREIDDYTATGEPMDKAGAYGIQGLGALLVERIEGDYSTVVGLPVCRLGRILTSFGVDPLALAAGRRNENSDSYGVSAL